jgi:hypothetical protein
MRTLVLIQMLLVVVACFADDEPSPTAATSCQHAAR